MALYIWTSILIAQKVININVSIKISTNVSIQKPKDWMERTLTARRVSKQFKNPSLFQPRDSKLQKNNNGLALGIIPSDVEKIETQLNEDQKQQTLKPNSHLFTTPQSVKEQRSSVCELREQRASLLSNLDSMMISLFETLPTDQQTEMYLKFTQLVHRKTILEKKKDEESISISPAIKMSSMPKKSMNRNRESIKTNVSAPVMYTMESSSNRNQLLSNSLHLDNDKPKLNFQTSHSVKNRMLDDNDSQCSSESMPKLEMTVKSADNSPLITNDDQKLQISKSSPTQKIVCFRFLVILIVFINYLCTEFEH